MNIDTPEKLSEALTTLDTNLPTYKTEVGATGGEITAVSQYRANLAQAIANGNIIETDKLTSTGIKYAVYSGDPNEPATKYPPFAVEPLPFPDLPGGAESFYRELKRRYKAANGYTKEIGIALGFEKDTPTDSPAETTPTVEGFPAKSGYHAAIIISNRGKSTMWKLLGRPVGIPKWREMLSGTGKSGNLTVEPATEGKPEQIEVKVQLYKNNDPYGVESDTIYITLNP